MKNSTKIKCPDCGAEIDVNEILYHQLEKDYKKEFTEKLSIEQDKLEKQKKELEKQRKKISNEIESRVAKKEKETRSSLEKELKAKLADEQDEYIKSLTAELEEKSKKVKEFHRLTVENEKLKRSSNEMKAAIEAEYEKKLTQSLAEERQSAIKKEKELNNLVVLELKKKLDDQKKLMEEMKRKHEQGSMQLQGEVQEIAIEDYLKTEFPLDEIAEVKKGARGADCLLTINTRVAINCGSIYVESKRTKKFHPSWIEKFKGDIRAQGADVGVLVTDVMPIDFERMGLIDGVWVCTFDEFKGLSKVLRESLIQIHEAQKSQENRGGKMNMLYDFLTSNEFKLQIEAIVEGFSQMKSDLDKEKRSMQRIWKTREKQIDKVIINTVDMYGSIKGIAGNAIGEIKALELPDNPKTT